MTANNEQSEYASITLCEADAAVIERLIAAEVEGESTSDLAGDGVSPERIARAQQLLGLLKQWPAARVQPGLAWSTVAGVLTADPASLSEEDGEALDALLELRAANLADGPMPAGSRERADRVSKLLSLMDCTEPEPAPGGLVERTLQAVERDRAEQERLSILSARGASPNDRPTGFSIRQLATTAALLLMVLSVLLPMLDKGRRDAMIASCSENLAGLGVDLTSYAIDNKGATTSPTIAAANPSPFRELSGFARKELDGSEVPASRVNLFLLIDQRRIESQHLACPSSDSEGKGYYSGQNPIAGGPLRVFLKPRPIFADSNPLYRLTPTGLVRNQDIPGLTRSQNHNGDGQNVLVSDGSVKWTVRPAFFKAGEQEDNIWLLQRPAQLDAQNDTEPDIFLTP